MAAVLVSSCAIAENQLEKIAPYPKAEAGMTRHVIELQPKSNENDYMVELVIGKTLKVDCNKQWFMGELDKKSYRVGDIITINSKKLKAQLLQ